MNDVMTVANANPDIQYRYVMTATETLPGLPFLSPIPIPGGTVPIWVKPSDLQKTYDIGYNDAIKAINNNSTAYSNFKDMIDDYKHFTLRDGFDWK